MGGSVWHLSHQLGLNIDRLAAARYGMNVSGAQSLVSAAVGETVDGL